MFKMHTKAAGLLVFALLFVAVGTVAAQSGSGGSTPANVVTSPQTVAIAPLAGSATIPGSGEAILWTTRDGSSVFYTIRVSNAIQPQSAVVRLNTGQTTIALPISSAAAAPTDSLVTPGSPECGAAVQTGQAAQLSLPQGFSGLVASGSLTTANLIGSIQAGTVDLNTLITQLAAGNVSVVVNTACGPLSGILRPVATIAPAGNQTVTFQSAFLQQGITLTNDFNQNGVNEPAEALGPGSLYDSSLPLIFGWQPVVGADAYRVSLVQMSMTPAQMSVSQAAGFPLPWQMWNSRQDQKVSYHSISDPNPTSFTMGALGVGESLCTSCPSYIVVQPVKAMQVFNHDTQMFEWQYTLIAGTPAQVSNVFWLSAQ